MRREEGGEGGREGREGGREGKEGGWKGGWGGEGRKGGGKRERRTIRTLVHIISMVAVCLLDSVVTDGVLSSRSGR